MYSTANPNPIACRRPCITDHQNRTADRTKLRCWAAWTNSLSSVGCISTGRCQTQSTIPWISQAANGLVMTRQTACHAGAAAARPIATAHSSGRAQAEALRGRPRTSSGAATSIRISCWVMCAANSTRPQGCSGETRAMTRATHPPQKHRASQRRTPRPGPDERHSRRTPRQYSHADRASRSSVTGSQPQVVSRSRRLCGCPPWARGRLAVARNISSWLCDRRRFSRCPGRSGTPESIGRESANRTARW